MDGVCGRKCPGGLVGQLAANERFLAHPVQPHLAPDKGTEGVGHADGVGQSLVHAIVAIRGLGKQLLGALVHEVARPQQLFHRGGVGRKVLGAAHLNKPLAGGGGLGWQARGVRGAGRGQHSEAQVRIAKSLGGPWPHCLELPAVGPELAVNTPTRLNWQGQGLTV